MNIDNKIVVGLVTIGIFSIISNSANAEGPVVDGTTAVVQITKEEAILSKYKNAASLEDEELKQLLWAVGFKGQKLKMAWSIAKAESNGRPYAFNGNKKTGDASYGIFQINMLGELGPDRREKFDLKSNAELFDPVKNAQVAFHMTGGGDDWSAWKNGKTERAQMFLSLYA
jgi:hypothetical protein